MLLANFIRYLCPRAGECCRCGAELFALPMNEGTCTADFTCHKAPFFDTEGMIHEKNPTIDAWNAAIRHVAQEWFKHRTTEYDAESKVLFLSQFIKKKACILVPLDQVKK